MQRIGHAKEEIQKRLRLWFPHRFCHPPHPHLLLHHAYNREYRVTETKTATGTHPCMFASLSPQEVNLHFTGIISAPFLHLLVSLMLDPIILITFSANKVSISSMLRVETKFARGLSNNPPFSRRTQVPSQSTKRIFHFSHPCLQYLHLSQYHLLLLCLQHECCMSLSVCKNHWKVM